MNGSDIDTLQIDLDRYRKLAVENEVKINPGKSKAVRFTTARVKYPLYYFGVDQRITEAGSCKYSVIVLRGDMSWVDQGNYAAQRGWTALLCIMRGLKTGNSNKESSAHTSLARPIL